MKDGFIKSAPHFFRLINRSMLLLTLVLLALAALLPAPLQEAADPSRTPNPVKSAWFLLWIQELVSWSRFMIYPLILLGLVFLLLPWLPGSLHLHRASWFPREQRFVNLLTIATFLVILILTTVAFWFRGSNWSFTLS